MLAGACGDIDCVEDCNGCGMVREYEEDESITFEGLGEIRHVKRG